MLDELQDVIDQVSQLPNEEQAFYAQLVRDELDNEAGWDERFANSHDALVKLLAEADEEIERGDVIELTIDNIDDVL